MSFAVRLPVDSVTIEPGATVPCTIEIVNTGKESDRFEMQVEGLDAEWTVVPVPEFSAGPGEQLSEKIFFKPARTSESLAGNYPFVVKVRSLISGDAKAAQGILQIRPFNYISMEVLPKRISVSPFHRRTSVKATIMNMGNSEHTIQLFGSDPDDDCVFEFEEEQIIVGPGQQKTVEVMVGAGATRVLASAKLYNFVLSARSISTPSVLTSAQGQLENRAPISPSALVGLAVLAIVGAIWIGAMPKPPRVRLAVDRLSVYRNDKVSLTWISSDAANIRLLKNNVEYAEVPAVTKGFPLTTDTDGVLKIEAIPVRDDGKEGEPSWVFITVTEPPPTPDPVIKSCYIQGTSTIKLGSPFILHYTIKNADKAYIGETMEPIDINVNERDLTGPSQTGKYSYTLIAQNGNKVTTRKFSITVIDPSTASIGSFAADPSVLTAAGPVTLRWHVSGATSLYLSGDDFPEQSLDINQTEIQVNIAKDSKFVLRAVDDKGRATTMSAKVQIQPIDLTPPPPSSAPDAQPTPPPTTPSLGNP